MRIVIASDHAGIELKTDLVPYLVSAGHVVEDLGVATKESVDYPDYARKVSETLKGSRDLGILVCGTGIGMSIMANKFHGIRAAVCTSEFEAKMARAHNDANVLCLGQRVVGAGVARGVVDAFLSTAFEGGRHAGRVEKINEMDGKR